jgi:hypothetical protein
MDAGRHRKLVPAGALRRGDFEGRALVLRRPRNDAAGVVALRPQTLLRISFQALACGTAVKLIAATQINFLIIASS